VYNVHSCQLWARDNQYGIHERGKQIVLSVSVWIEVVEDIVVGPYLLPDRLTVQRYRGFLGIVLLGLLEDVPLTARQRLRFQHEGNSSALQGMCTAMVERDIFRKVDWTSGADCMASSVTGFNSDGLGRFKEHVYAVPPPPPQD
jgi:hypothetical protein